VFEPVNIMHLRASNFVGGPEKQILEHFARLDSARFRPVLGTFAEPGELDPLGDEAARRGMQTARVPQSSPLNPKAILHISRMLRRHNIGILCTHGYKPNVLGFFAARLCGIPTIAISRGWTWENRKIRVFEALDRRFLHYVDHVVAVSAGQEKKILDCGVPQGRVSVIHNAINLDDCPLSAPPDLRREFGLPAAALIVASAGRLSPEKNYSAMVTVAGEVAARNPLVYFFIFGEGVQRPELEGQIAAAGLNGRFLLPGFRRDLQALLHDIDIFMLPSFTEGLPNVILEAFAARKPVLATRVGGTPEVVQEGISGFLTAPGETDLMARHLIALAGDPLLRGKLGAAGREYAREEFGFEKQTRLYEKLYEQVAK
jgi:glycosyltransferase involved in cell wall biosynthesis